MIGAMRKKRQPIDDLIDAHVWRRRTRRRLGTGLTNYAHAHRHELRISSAPAESGMSHLVNQRMGKRQPMCWSLEGAHFLLQVRCAELDGRLETLFREWPSRFRLTPTANALPLM
jgi:hypothetical protein